MALASYTKTKKTRTPTTNSTKGKGAHRCKRLRARQNANKERSDSVHARMVAGRPRKLSEKAEQQLVQVLTKLQNQCKGRVEVTARMILSRWKGKGLGDAKLNSKRRYAQRLLKKHKFVFTKNSKKCKPEASGSEVSRASYAKKMLRNFSLKQHKGFVFMDNHSVVRCTTPLSIAAMTNRKGKSQYRPVNPKTGKPYSAKSNPQYVDAKSGLLYQGSGRVPLILSGSCDRVLAPFVVSTWNLQSACDLLKHIRKQLGDNKMRVIVLDNDPVWDKRKKLFALEAERLNFKLNYTPSGSPDLMTWDLSCNKYLDERLLEMATKKPQARMSRKKFMCRVKCILRSKNFLEHYRKTVTSIYKKGYKAVVQSKGRYCK